MKGEFETLYCITHSYDNYVILRTTSALVLSVFAQLYFTLRTAYRTC